MNSRARGEATARTRAALGFRSHSGWAAVVAVAGPAGAPRIADRRRIELVDPATPESKQPYHAAQGLDLEAAGQLVRRSTEAARRLAWYALRAAIDDVRTAGHDIVGCGVLLGSGRPATTLEATLASHALIHTAEGDLFRGALVHAIERCNLPVTRVRERDLYARGAAELSVPVHVLEGRVAELGRALGPPWRQDEKYAALVGWLALAASSRA
jgi:hypothetical protein